MLGVVCTLQEISEEVGVRLNLNSSLTTTESAELEFDISQTHLLGKFTTNQSFVLPVHIALSQRRNQVFIADTD